MNKFYPAWDFETDNCVVMEHVNGNVKEVCRGKEADCLRIISAMEFLYVTAAERLQTE